MPATRHLIAAILWLSLPALAAAQSATDRVNALNQGIIALMKAAEQKVPASTRLQQFEPVVRENYDLETSHVLPALIRKMHRDAKVASVGAPEDFDGVRAPRGGNHRRALGRERLCNRGSDAAGRAGHKRDFSGKIQH